MRTLIAIALPLVILLPALSQTPANTGMAQPKDPKEILTAAARFYDFASPELKPWHLKVRYQFYDLKGNPAEQGTWEYWWASPKVHRSSWTRTSAEHTEWSTAEGVYYRKDAGNPLRYFERTIEASFFFPLPESKVADSSGSKLELKMLPAQKPDLACVLTTQQSLHDGKLQPLGWGEPHSYCFDPATLALRMTSSNHLITQFEEEIKTQGRYLARQVVVSEDKQKLFTAAVETIDVINAEEAMLKAPADAIPQQQTLSLIPEHQSCMTLGSTLKSAAPTYPLAAQAAHQQGVVILGAIMGTDGKIHDVDVLASPYPNLTESARETMKQWEFKPCLVNGMAVEVGTIGRITYSSD